MQPRLVHRVRTSGAEAKRLLAVTAKALLMDPARIWGSIAAGASIIMSICPATKSWRCRGGAAIGHMRKVMYQVMIWK